MTRLDFEQDGSAGRMIAFVRWLLAEGYTVTDALDQAEEVAAELDVTFLRQVPGAIQ